MVSQFCGGEIKHLEYGSGHSVSTQLMIAILLIVVETNVIEIQHRIPEMLQKMFVGGA